MLKFLEAAELRMGCLSSCEHVPFQHSLSRRIASKRSVVGHWH
jgi:hypothetical protein